jgi:hypothetical protein
MNLKYKFAQAQEDAPSERKRTSEKLRWYHKSCALAVVAVFLFLASVPVRAEPVDPNLPLPQLLQKLHDLYLDEYPLFAEAFSRAVKLPSKTTYGQELKSNVNLSKPYEHMIVDYSARLIRNVSPLSADRAEQKETINELISLQEHLADTNSFLADVLLKLSFETGVDWREQFQKLQSESLFYQQLLRPRIQQLIAKTF